MNIIYRNICTMHILLNTNCITSMGQKVTKYCTNNLHASTIIPKAVSSMQCNDRYSPLMRTKTTCMWTMFYLAAHIKCLRHLKINQRRVAAVPQLSFVIFRLNRNLNDKQRRSCFLQWDPLKPSFSLLSFLSNLHCIRFSVHTLVTDIISFQTWVLFLQELFSCT